MKFRKKPIVIEAKQLTTDKHTRSWMRTFKWTLDLWVIKIGYCEEGLASSVESTWRKITTRLYVIV